VYVETLLTIDDREREKQKPNAVTKRGCGSEVSIRHFVVRAGKRREFERGC